MEKGPRGHFAGRQPDAAIYGQVAEDPRITIEIDA